MAAEPSRPPAGAVRWSDRLSLGGSRSKADLWRGEHLFAGVDYLPPGQEQPLHRHAGADKVYLVLQGAGTFEVGAERFTAGEGELVPAPAEVPHGVRNDGEGPLVVLAVIAPPPRRR